MVQPAGTAQPARPQAAPLLQSIVAASPEFAEIFKDSSNAFLNSRYLKLPGLLKIIKPPLLEQGVIVYTQVIFDSTASQWVVRTTLSSVSGQEEIYSDFPIHESLLGNLQKIGGAITYGTRYNLFALLAICPQDEDDDGNSGSSGGSAYNAPATAGGLPGLPGMGAPSPAVWPAPGQEVKSPSASLPGMLANPVQPSPVLPQ